MGTRCTLEWRHWANSEWNRCSWKLCHVSGGAESVFWYMFVYMWGQTSTLVSSAQPQMCCGVRLGSVLGLGLRGVKNCPVPVLDSFLSSLRTEFLDLGNVGIWSQLTLFGEMFSSMPGLCPWRASLVPGCNNQKCLQMLQNCPCLRAAALEPKRNSQSSGPIQSIREEYFCSWGRVLWLRTKFLKLGWDFQNPLTLSFWADNRTFGSFSFFTCQMGIRVAPTSVTSRDRCRHKMLGRTPGVSALDISATITINGIVAAIIIEGPLATPTGWDNHWPSFACRLPPPNHVDRASHSLIKLFTFPA